MGMSGFVDKMRLKEMAEEDVYFARRDRELIEALRKKKESGAAETPAAKEQTSAFRLKIVSGGQTGVDRAALDVALAMGLDTGGWCPRGRRALDGRIPERYTLRETPSSHYSQRTEWNVRDSDATLILTRGTPSGGTRLTLDLARRYGRPVRVVDLALPPPVSEVRDWLRGNGVHVLNVAGPREEGAPGIRRQAADYLVDLLA
jgi:hypothetical protein